jgi:hypothetical protein
MYRRHADEIELDLLIDWIPRNGVGSLVAREFEESPVDLRYSVATKGRRTRCGEGQCDGDCDGESRGALGSLCHMASRCARSEHHGSRGYRLAA